MRTIIIFLFSSILISFVIGDYEHIKEMGFKFWLDPGVEECYHELLEKGSTLYFIYEILNPHSDGDNIIVFFRNAHNGSIVAISKSTHRGNLQLSMNETTLIDICISHEQAYSYVKYLSVFFHIYYIEKILAQLKEVEEFDNSSINARETINSISRNVIISREHQKELVMLNQKDRYLIEKNFAWINHWAFIHILIISSCFLFQTYFIKRLFKTSRK